MTGRRSDTSSAAAEIQANVHRRLTGVERLRIAVDMSLTARELAKARVRQDHPEWTNVEVNRAVLQATLSASGRPRSLR